MTAAVMACTEPWCSNHITDDDLVMHASRDAAVPMTAGGRAEQFTAAVCVERNDDPDGDAGRARVRLELVSGPKTFAFTAGGLMTPEQALQLARELERAAKTAERATSTVAA